MNPQIDNLDKIDQFLERDNLPEFIHEEKNNLNRPMSITETESITNNTLKIKRNNPRWVHYGNLPKI